MPLIVVAWLPQGLTLRYILMRPDLSRLRKARGEKNKYRLCGRAYSSLNPRNSINYIYLTVILRSMLSDFSLSVHATPCACLPSPIWQVILAEFFTLASVCFHSNIPWRTTGAREADRGVAEWLQYVLPQV